MPYRILVCDRRADLLATLEAVLRHWGYRVLTARSSDKLKELLGEIKPDLLLIDEQLVPELHEHLQPLLQKNTPLMLLANETLHLATSELNHDRLHVPLDIFELFSLTQKHLEEIPRRNLRMNISLPGLLSLDAANHLVEVVSLSSHGLFIKTPLRFERGDVMQIVIPLLGMKREIEVNCRVLYNIVPCNDNNYLQGFGVEFTTPDPATLKTVQQFLEQRMLGEMATNPSTQYDVAMEHLKTHNDQSLLRLIMHH